MHDNIPLTLVTPAISSNLRKQAMVGKTCLQFAFPQWALTYRKTGR
jgi:hypothetical protein